MKTLLAIAFTVISFLPTVQAQTTPPPTPVSSPITNLVLPTYIAGGAAYNQLAGWNLWFSAIVPVANNSGFYESTTTDLFPTASTTNGKTVYTFQTSIRQGVHKTIHTDSKNTLLIGGDAGVAFTQSSTTGTATTSSPSSVGASGSFTLTYVRSLTPHFGVIVPVRGLYLPTLGWNPVVEIGLVWKP